MPPDDRGSTGNVGIYLTNRNGRAREELVSLRHMRYLWCLSAIMHTRALRVNANPLLEVYSNIEPYNIRPSKAACFMECRTIIS